MQTALTTEVHTCVNAILDIPEMEQTVQVWIKNVSFQSLQTSIKKKYQPYFPLPDINECENNACDQNANCSNSVGSYSCACHTGYNGDGTICTGIVVVFLEFGWT